MARILLHTFLYDFDSSQPGDEVIKVYYYEKPIDVPNAGQQQIVPIVEKNENGDIIERPVLEVELPVASGIGTGPVSYKFCVHASTTLVQFVRQEEWPFADKQEIPNSPLCIVGVCDILIRRPIDIVKDSGAGDGTATVTIESEKVGNETLEYSLNNQNWTVISAFPLVITNLPAGDYTIWVREQADATCFDNADFTVGLVAAVEYGLRYEFSYINFFDQVCELEIYQREYLGDPEEVEAASEPVDIYQFPHKKMDKIWGKECIINLIATSNFQFFDLYNSDDRKYRVLYKIEGVLEFQGYITQEYSEPYDMPDNYYVTVRAVDGLGRWKFMNFRDQDGAIIKGRRSIMEMITICLKKLDLDAKIITHINITEDSTLGDPLRQAYVLADQYQDDKCYQVVEKLLASFFAYIKQEGGDWHIYHVPELTNDTIHRREYTLEGLFRQDEDVSLLLQITEPDPDDPALTAWVQRRQGLDIINPFGNITVKFDYGLDENLIANSDFIETNESGALLNFSGDAPYQRNRDKDGNYSLNIQGVVGDFGEAEYVITDKFPISNAIQHKYVLKFSYATKRIIAADLTGMEIRVRLQNGNNYLQDDNTWDTTPAEKIITPANVNTFYNYELELPAPPDPTPMQVLFFQMFKNGISPVPLQGYEIKDLRFEFLPNGEYHEPDAAYIYENSLFSSFGSEEIPVHVGDGPDVELAANIVKNAITLINGSASDSWSRDDREESKHLLEIFLEDVAAQMGVPRQRLSGVLRSSALRPNSVIIDKDQPNKRYMIMSDRWNTKRCEHTVELEEVGDTDEPYTVEALLTMDGVPVVFPNGDLVLLMSDEGEEPPSQSGGGEGIGLATIGGSFIIG